MMNKEGEFFMQLKDKESANPQSSVVGGSSRRNKMLTRFLISFVVIVVAYSLAWEFTSLTLRHKGVAHSDTVHLEIGKEYTISAENPLIIKTDRVTHFPSLGLDFKWEQVTRKKTYETRIALDSIGGVMSLDDGEPVRSVAFTSPKSESVLLSKGNIYLQPDKSGESIYGNGMAFRVIDISEESITLSYLGYGQLISFTKK